MSKRKTHLWTDGCDTYAAVDPAHVAEVYERHMGDSYDEVSGPVEEHWSMIEDDAEVTVDWIGKPEGFEAAKVEAVEDSHFPDHDHRVTAKASEWAEFIGEGFVSTTEY
jgi:hypothetical protein